jgi:hypothetical protein
MTVFEPENLRLRQQQRRLFLFNTKQVALFCHDRDWLGGVMTFVKLLLYIIVAFNLIICLWIGCAVLLNVVRSRNKKNAQMIEDSNASPPIEDSLG